MSCPAPLEDGNLPAAKTRLGDAISGLVDPVKQVVDNRLLWTDSLYQQLVEAIPGEKGARTGVSRSQPPLWIDAEDLLREIDTAVCAWEPRPLIDLVDEELPPVTVIRLRALEKRGWRPQDVNAMEQIAGNVESWAASIKSLLNPPPKWTLPNPCTACNVAVVYRKNSAGETVRQPALQLTADGGCECQNCHYVWAPYRIQILAAALGYELPAGVLE